MSVNALPHSVGVRTKASYPLIIWLRDRPRWGLILVLAANALVWAVIVWLVQEGSR